MSARRSGFARSLALVGALVTLVAIQGASAAETASAAALRATYDARQDAIAHSAFGMPLVLDSTERDGVAAGDVLARMDFPFQRVRSALADVRDWCEILILHPNIEGCRVEPAAAGDAAIAVDIGRARIPVRFSYRLAASDSNFLHVELRAPQGPLGTTDYRIELEAAPLDTAHTIIHFAFSQRYGASARFAMDTYLATFGRGKVGFTVAGRDAQGEPRYVGGFRGALERNVMRYYAAIDAYVASLSVPRSAQRDARLRRWYQYTERFPAQLQEEPGYLERKQAELGRQPLPS